MSQPEVSQTLVLIKPDALKLSLTGYVLSQLSEFHTGLRFAGAKIVHVSRLLAEEHYAEHKGKYFYPPLIDYLTGRLHYRDAPHRRRVIALVYSGPNAVAKVREISGPTSPHVARERAPGTIRALGTVVPVKDAAGKVVGERMDNLIHASATEIEAEREIKLWFRPADIMPAMRMYATGAAETSFFLKDGKVATAGEPEGICFLAKGDMAWQSDLDALRNILAGQPAACSVDGVVAKYLMNEKLDED